MTRVTLWLGRTKLGVALLAGLCLTPAAGAGRQDTPPIVFAALRAASYEGQIYGIDLARGRRTNLSHGPAVVGSAGEPSPDGKRLAFVSDRAGYRAVYLVGLDGSRLTRISGRFRRPFPDIRLSWAPGADRLAATVAGLSPRLRHGWPKVVYIMQPGKRQREIARFPLGSPAWSPDGRLIAVHTGTARRGFVRTLTSEGKPVWREPGANFAWSRHGDLVAAVTDGIRVYDAHGNVQSAFTGRAYALSPGGDQLADVEAGRLQVRTEDGRRVVFGNRVRGLASEEYVVVSWANRFRIVISSASGNVFGVNIANGKAWRPGRPFAGYLPHGLLEATRRDKGFALRALGFDGRPIRTIARLPGCIDDGNFVPAVIDPVLTPDRRSLVYQGSCAPESDLYAIAPDGTRLRRLTSTAGIQETEPQWSPDGTRIAYSRTPATIDECKGCPITIWAARADGSHRRPLTTPHDFTRDGSPSWSPDGRQIVFSRSTPSRYRLAVVSASGGHAHPLPVDATQAVWGSAGITYAGFPPGASEGDAYACSVGVTSPCSSSCPNGCRHAAGIWTVQRDGSHARWIAPGRIPAISRDGRLAYVVEPTGIDASGRFLEHHSSVVVRDRHSARRFRLPLVGVDSLGWSPDGSRLVLTARPNDSAPSDVYVVGAEGRHLMRLTSNLNASGASWRAS